MRVLVAEARRVVELGQLDEPARPVADLLFELPPGRLHRRLAVDIALAGGHLQQIAVGRDAVLAHEQSRFAARVDRDDHDRAGMAHDVTDQPLVVGRGDLLLGQLEEADVGDRLRPDDLELSHAPRRSRLEQV